MSLGELIVWNVKGKVNVKRANCVKKSDLVNNAVSSLARV